MPEPACQPQPPCLPMRFPLVGPGFPACRRASARRGAGIRKIFGSSRQARLNRIPLDIPTNPLTFLVAANQVIVALVLPERLRSFQTEHTMRLVRRESLERSEPLSRSHPRRDQQMHMVRHHCKGMQLVAPELLLSIDKCLPHHLRDLPLSQKNRPAPLTVQQPIHRHESLPGRQTLIWKSPPNRKASIQPERDKQSLAGHMPVRKASIIPHVRSVIWPAESSQTDHAGQKPGGRLESLAPLSAD